MYSAFTTAETDADSPATETLFTKIKDNDDFWATVIDTSTAKVITNGVVEGSITASSVSAGKLKFSSAAGTIACGATGTTVSLGTVYGHHVYFTRTHVGGTAASYRFGRHSTSAVSINEQAICTLGDGSTPSPTTFSYSSQYHAACPPHDPFGVGEWGTFILLHRLAGSGLELNAWTAQDPPWHMGDHAWHRYPKDDKRALIGWQSPIQMDEASLIREIDSGGMAYLGVSPGDRPELVLIDTREICLATVDLCPHLERATLDQAELDAITDDVVRAAPEGEARAKILTGRDSLAARIEASRAAAKPVRMNARDALAYRAMIRGTTSWDLLKSERPEIIQATAEALHEGKPIRSGVPDFDDKVRILRP